MIHMCPLLFLGTTGFLRPSPWLREKGRPPRRPFELKRPEPKQLGAHHVGGTKKCVVTPLSFASTTVKPCGGRRDGGPCLDRVRTICAASGLHPACSTLLPGECIPVFSRGGGGGGACGNACWKPIFSGTADKSLHSHDPPFGHLSTTFPRPFMPQGRRHHHRLYLQDNPDPQINWSFVQSISNSLRCTDLVGQHTWNEKEDEKGNIIFQWHELTGICIDSHWLSWQLPW